MYSTSQKKSPVSVLFYIPFRSVFLPVSTVPVRSVPYRSVPFRSVPYRSVPFTSVLIVYRGQAVLALGMNSSAKFTACIGEA